MSTIIGIAGTAKNTGKTTTLNALLQDASVRNFSIGITSIGYDGEEIDNITGLPKPRITVHEGMIVSTSLDCVPKSGWSILERTGFLSALGEIVIARCERTGPIVLAGPNKKSDLLTVTQKMTDQGCALIVVDGALNRIAPMSVADKIIFTTGAARNTDISFLVKETKAIENIFQFSQLSPMIQRDISRSTILHTSEEVDDLLKNPVSGSQINIEGMISLEAFMLLRNKIETRSEKKITHIIIDDPITLLLCGMPAQTMSVVEGFLSSGVTFLYRKTISLAVITLNPFYPDYHGMTYSSSFLDADVLSAAMKENLLTPTFDLFKTKNNRLWDVLLR